MIVLILWMVKRWRNRTKSVWKVSKSDCWMAWSNWTLISLCNTNNLQWIKWFVIRKKTYNSLRPKVDKQLSLIIAIDHLQPIIATDYRNQLWQFTLHHATGIDVYTICKFLFYLNFNSSAKAALMPYIFVGLIC